MLCIGIRSCSEKPDINIAIQNYAEVKINLIGVHLKHMYLLSETLLSLIYLIRLAPASLENPSD